MRILRRPMFKKGGSANEGVMSGLVDRSTYAGGGTIGGGTIQGTPMGYRTGFVEPYSIGSTVSQSKAAAKAIADMYGVWQESDLVNQASKVAKPSRLASWFGRTGIGTLPIAYFGLSKAIQESLPEELKSTPDFAYGKQGIYERAGYPDPMSAGADISPEVDEILRSAGRGEGRKDPMGSGFYDTLIEHGGGLTEEAKEKRKIERLSDKLDKDTGGLDDIKIKETIADKRSRLNKRAKEFLDILSPEAQKRAVIDATAAASEAFGQSTGDTSQDIANAITAAAKASGGSQELVLMAKKLAIQEDIERGLKKDTKDSVFAEKTKAYMEAYPKAEGESMEDYKARILGMVKERADDDWRALKLKYSQTYGKTQGPKRFVRDYYSGKKDFGGIAGEDEIVEGKKYYDSKSDRWVIYENGSPSFTTAPGE